MNNLLKNNNNSTTDNTIKKDDNKTIFGGKVQSYFTQPKDYIHKIPTGRELASFKFHNVGHVLKLLPITGKDGHNKKYLLKVDSIIVYEVQKDECKTILIDFLYKYCANVANMLFDLSQKKINHNMDDKVKQLILLTNCINLIRQYLIKGEYKLINKSISLINKEGLYHYFINNINEFKAAKQYKVLNFCLNGLQAWIALMYEMSRLDPIKNENENEKLVQVAEHHIHNFIYDYALLKPVHDLYNVYFHPSISSSLIEFTYVMNRMVKAFFKTQTSITAKKKRIRSRKNQGNKKSKLDQLEDDFNQKMNLLNPDELILSYDLENNETQSENKRINGNESESEKNSEEEEYDDRVITFQRYKLL
ncbi:hypothetical protein K502DRAFT_212932 [Neoconidiobolus thromboides FSU 785]|nr:hypothetical protein K502DRAFT_212932 [Neoconidiobolus thromboides FSU 785]